VQGCHRRCFSNELFCSPPSLQMATKEWAARRRNTLPAGRQSCRRWAPWDPCCRWPLPPAVSAFGPATAIPVGAVNGAVVECILTGRSKLVCSADRVDMSPAQALGVWLCVHAGLGQPCSWTEEREWTGGAKAMLKINIEQVCIGLRDVSYSDIGRRCPTGTSHSSSART
jgi:hypothetical protein